MISDSFDMESEAIITPSSFFGEKGKICDIAIATFSREIFPAVLKLFENEKLFYPMEEECDTLEDMHANQHIPQIIGAMDLYRATGDEIYWEIGKNFWNIVTGGHTYCIGGIGYM